VKLNQHALVQLDQHALVQLDQHALVQLNQGALVQLDHLVSRLSNALIDISALVQSHERKEALDDFQYRL
jgi:hypothetical protein